MSSNILSISLSLTNPPRRIPIEIKSDANAKSLFEAASKATHIPTAGMKLIFRGRIIANKGDGDEMNVIEEFKLEDRSVIHCMGKPNPPSVDVDASVNVAATSATTNSGSTVIPPAASASASASAPSIAVSSNPLKSSLQQMKISHPGIDYKIGLTTLSKLLQNVIQNPMEQKYRKVKKTNAAFEKKLGRLNGANEAILAIGFQTVGEEYVLTPSPEAWPALLESKATLDQAVRDYEAQQSRPMPAATGDMGFGGMPNFGMGMGAGAGMPGMGGMNMPPGMEQAMSSMLSDPQALQNMLNDPMVQNMMQNHPQFANNPMAQQQMRTLANNPQMLQQMSQMMSNPQMMSRMQQMMQNNGAMGAMGGMGGMGNHTNANNTGMPAAGSGSAMDMNRQMEIMRQFANMNNANASTNDAASGGASGNQNTNNAGSNNTNNNGGSDGQMTEEEMIAAAIARSLREQ